MRRIAKVIIHCAETPDEGDQFGFEDINQWHKERGFLDPNTGIHCGYHYIYRRSGVIEFGRPESSIGAHCAGENHDSLGLCTMSTRALTRPQMESLLFSCVHLSQVHSLTPEDFYGHREFNSSKNCPGHDMMIFRALLSLYMNFKL